ncbi:MAG: protein kinase [Gammaproteobacteria bacterium]|nr:protein kinase [Gammaproteobacteria bacterium]
MSAADEFNTALASYLRHRIPLEALSDALARAISENPESLPKLRSELEALRDTRKLALQDYAKLELHLLQLDKQQTKAPEKNWDSPEYWRDGWENEAPADLRRDALIAETYRLQAQLAADADTETWEAKELADAAAKRAKRHVRITFLAPRFRENSQDVQAFAERFTLYRQLEHPRIAKLYAAGHADGRVFVASEIPPLSLDNLLENHPAGVPLNEVRVIIAGLAEALEYAYGQGIPYLEIERSSVFYDAVQKTVKILDFGLGPLMRKIGAEGCSPLSDAYCSEEYRSGLGPPDAQSGVYALACLAYELLTGRHPFGRKNCREAREKNFHLNPVKDLAPKQWRALQHGLALQSKQRTATPARFVAEMFPEQRQTRGYVAALLVAGGLLIGGAYWYFEVWQYQQALNGIRAAQPAAVTALENSAAKKQLKILEKGGRLGRMALLDFYLRHTGTDTLSQLARYHPDAKEVLLRDPDVKNKLTEYYLHEIDAAAAGDDFIQALLLLRNLAEHYPDISDHEAAIVQQRGQRFAELTAEYNKCLHLTATPLYERSPCLLDARGLMTQIDPQRPLPAAEELSAAYRTEAEKLIAVDAYPAAERVLADWLQLLPETSPERDSLSWILTRTQEIEQQLEAEEFARAAEQLAEALALYPESAKFSAYTEVIRQRKTAKLEELAGKYRGYREKGSLLPNESGEDLFDVRARILKIDAEHELLRDSSLHEAFFRKTVEVSGKPEDTLTRLRAFFAAWQVLFADTRHFQPEDQENRERAINRVALRYLLKGEELQAQGEREQAVAYLRFALELNPVGSAKLKLSEALERIQAVPEAPPTEQEPAPESADQAVPEKQEPVVPKSADIEKKPPPRAESNSDAPL